MNRLKEYRLKANISQRDLSKITGISEGRYNHYEIGRRELPVSIAKRIGEVLKIEWWKLYEWFIRLRVIREVIWN